MCWISVGTSATFNFLLGTPGCSKLQLVIMWQPDLGEERVRILALHVCTPGIQACYFCQAQAETPLSPGSWGRGRCIKEKLKPSYQIISSQLGFRALIRGLGVGLNTVDPLRGQRTKKTNSPIKPGSLAQEYQAHRERVQSKQKVPNEGLGTGAWVWRMALYGNTHIPGRGGSPSLYSSPSGPSPDPSL